MDSLKAIAQRIVAFRDQRDWKQFHTPKDMLLALTIEVAELAELMQWKSGAQLAEALEMQRSELGDELADVLYWVLLIAHDLRVDIGQAFERKMAKNESKYPVELCKGRSDKYTQLGLEPSRSAAAHVKLTDK